MTMLRACRIACLYIIFQMLVPAVVQAKGDYLALGHITYTDANTPQEFSFNADTFKTLVYSYSFFEKYEIGFVVDFNETEEEVNNTAILLGIEGSFIRIKRGRNTGKFNGVPFDYERNSIQWYRLGIGGGGDAKPLWGIFNGLTYTKFSSPGEIFDDDQSEFVPIRQIDVVMLGMVGVTDLMRKKMLNSYRKSDWGFESDAAFGLARITPHHPQYKEVSTIAFEGTLKAGYYWKLFHNDPYTADESAGGLFLGYRYDFLFDFLGLYRSGDSIYIPERGGWEVRLSFEF